MDRQMCLSNICIQLRKMEMHLLTSCLLPPELWSWEPRYVKIQPPHCFHQLGLARWYSYVCGLNWILVFAQLMVSPRGCASSFITSRARTSTDSISAKRASSSANSKLVKIAFPIDMPTILQWTVRSRSQSIGTRNVSGATTQPWRTPSIDRKPLRLTSINMDTADCISVQRLEKVN